MPDWTESPEDVASFRAALLRFFDREARPLPWRSTRDPYRILVSEIMAQQTRVETVIPYYRRWLERFPTLGALADAGRDDVLKLWEGLGYYSRARNLHRAAQTVRESFGGQLPDSPAELRTLPGVGPYTAGAVASIAFGEPVPAVDGNVRRVFARLHDDPVPGARAVEDWAARVVDPDRAGDFNQALMELGAIVCVPRGPHCGRCPVVSWCRARSAGTQEERPLPKKRSRVRREERVVVVNVDVGGQPEHGREPDVGREQEAQHGRRDRPPRVWLRRRPDEGLLAGLWEFPSFSANEAEAADVASAGEPLAPVRHLFSHLHVTYRPYVLYRSSAEVDGRGEASQWVDLSDLGGVAVPVAQQKIAALARRFLRRTHA